MIKELLKETLFFKFDRLWIRKVGHDNKTQRKGCIAFRRRAIHRTISDLTSRKIRLIDMRELYQWYSSTFYLWQSRHQWCYESFHWCVFIFYILQRFKDCIDFIKVSNLFTFLHRRDNKPIYTIQSLPKISITSR